MLRMIQAVSAAQAQDYFNDALLKSSYYLDEQELKGSFHGRIAKRIGIGGEASKQAFDDLCENIHPITGKNLTPLTVQHRTVGYDINFHCPKSVSVLHILSKDDHILDVFRSSVRETMQDIEDDSKVRVRKNGKDEDRNSGELIWGEFIHQTSRPVKDAESDMHVHAHCFTFNVSYDPIEKQYKAGQFRHVKADMPFYEAKFHKRLADKLVDLGYQVRRTRTAFEVVGVPQLVIDLFSKRTNEIGQFAKQNNITDAIELDKIGERTRRKKQKDRLMSELKKDWVRQIRELGMTGDGKGGGDTIRFGKPVPDSLTVDQAVDHALLHRFERASVAPERRILETAFRFAVGKISVTIDQIADHFKRDRRIIKVKDGSKIMCTTKEVLDEERRMVALANAGKGKLIPLYRSPPSLSLEGDANTAACHVLTTSDRVSIVIGGAGTGKTTLLTELVGKIRAVNIDPVIVAPTAQASRGVLRSEGFDDAETVAKLLSNPTLQERLTNSALIVDEAGLLGTQHMTQLLELAEKHNARLILLGDSRQHAAILRGDSLRVLNQVAGIVPAEVNKIYRQKNKEYCQAVQDLSQGNVKSAFEKLTALESVKQIDPENPYTGLVDDYIATLQRGKTALVVSPTHHQGDNVTKALREKLKEIGKLEQKEITVSRLVNLNLTEGEKADPVNYTPGTVLQFKQNRTGIRNGSRLSVVAVANDTLSLEDKGGNTIAVPLSDSVYFDVFRKQDIGLAEGDRIRITRNAADTNNRRLNNGQSLEVVSIDSEDKIIVRHPDGKVNYALPHDFGHFAHAYAITSHAAQGQTCDECYVFQPAATFPATDLKQFYVSVSRGRDRVHIYTDDKEALL